ncbi:Clostridium P-47 protein [Serratia ficaria]|uniref:TULIP family P47-like protein n=1 Tax=Serratia ficaria TaxID=61651 RepID=UPI0011992AAE|nr:TULIP family P47-like protein [Serratia ficaria]VVA49795.1 Clostridium P-47 protein [Serratia ficaria]
MDIYNWDMVCAVSCTELNKKLKAASQDAFGNFRWSDDEGNAISGTFSGWEIVTGGDAQRINIIAPLSMGTLTIPALGKNNVPVDGLCPKLQVELMFVNAESGNGDTQLRFNLAQVSKKDIAVAAGNGSVVVLDADVNHLFPGVDAIIPKMYCEMMAEMLVAMQDKIKFIFASVADIPTESDALWMKPVLLAYAYNEKINGEPGCLAVLATLDNTGDDGLIPLGPGPERQLVFDSALIREGGSIGFMLSRHMFMKRVIRPGLPGVFKGSGLSQYSLDADDVIRNNGAVSLNKVQGYTPYFNHLELKVVDNRVIINNASGSCDVGADRSYNTFTLSAAYAAELSYSGAHCYVALNSVNGPLLDTEIHDDLAKALWIFGGKRVDELLHSIKDDMNGLLFEFSTRMNFEVWPITFSTDASYKKCGLAGNFYMQD